MIKKVYYYDFYGRNPINTKLPKVCGYHRSKR